MVSLRHITAAVLVTAGAALFGAPQAGAARVTVLEGGKLRSYDDPALDGVSSYPAPRAWAAGCGPCAAGSRTAVAAAKRPDPVRRAIRRALAEGRIDPEAASRYRSIYARALGVRGKLGFQRGRELGYVIGVLQGIARRGSLGPQRMPALFLTLDRNREWWGSKGAPGSGARVRFGSTRLIFQYYPGHGLQIQPLANFGAANGYWYSSKDSQLRALVDELVAIRVGRGSFTTWEYYFHFGGGAPPWMSGMAQATAVQALTRAGTKLGDPSLLAVAREGLGAFESSTPVGARVPTESGAWYALYSFDPRLEVLNGMLQSLIGLHTYATLTGDARGLSLFEQGDRVAKARMGLFDTGAWSLYNRGGAEANLNYHTLNRDFARRLCKLTAADPYCTSATNFTRYMREDPGLEPFGPAPAPARGGRRVRFYFTLSKLGRVGITVTGLGAGGERGRTYLSTSAAFGRGRRAFGWVPPRSRVERTYEYKLFAKDLAGNSASESGTLRVKGSRP